MFLKDNVQQKALLKLIIKYIIIQCENDRCGIEIYFVYDREHHTVSIIYVGILRGELVYCIVNNNLNPFKYTIDDVQIQYIRCSTCFLSNFDEQYSNHDLSYDDR